MDNINPHMLEERLAQLPEDVRNAVLSVEWEGKVQAIGQKHRLHIDQIGALGDLTLMAMIGLVNLSDYPARMTEELKIPPSDAAALTAEIGDEVFMPIRESLKKISGIDAKTPIEPSTPSAPSAPVTAKPTAAPSATSITIKTPSAPAPVPAALKTPAPATEAAKPIAAPTTPAKPDLSAADALLSATTVTTVATPAAPQAATGVQPAAQPPKPAAYATDPYREPPV